MKCCFLMLDIDGVMNTNNAYLDKQGGVTSWPIEPGQLLDYNPGWTQEARSSINEIVSTLNCSIVISSTWRFDMSVEDFNAFLPVNNRVIGVTRNLSNLYDDRNAQFDHGIRGVTRAMEVIEWMITNAEDGLDSPFVALDDMPIALSSKNKYNTNPYTGLVESDTKQIIEKFHSLGA